MNVSTPNSNEEALRLYQELLDRLSTAVLAGDLDTVSGCFSLPTRINTLASTITIETDAELREGYRQLGANLHASGATHFFWLAKMARWVSPNYIEAFHVTHALKNSQPLMEPYHARVMVRFDGENYMVDEVDIQLENTSWPFEPPKLAPGKMSGFDPRKVAQDDARIVETDPLVVYSRFMKTFTACQMNRDFEAWSSMHLYPHTFHTDASDQVVKTPEGHRSFFQMIDNMLNDGRCDRLERVPSRAAFLSGNQICGYHEAIMYRGDEIVFGPVKSRTILQRVGADWYVRSITNAISNDGLPCEAPHVTESLISINSISDRRKS